MMINNEKLDEKCKFIWRYVDAIEWLVTTLVAAIAVVILLQFNIASWILIGIGILYGVYALYTIISISYLVNLSYDRWSYSVTPHEVRLHKGIIVQSKIHIPIRRIQFITLKQGPLLKKYALANLEISNAAEKLEIPCLNLEKANQLCEDLKKIIEDKI